MSRIFYKNNLDKNDKKEKLNSILINKNKFGPEGYFGNLSKKFFFQYSLIAEESILCDIKINNSIKCFFTTLKTFQKEKIHSKYFDGILEKIHKDISNIQNNNIYLLLYLDVKDDYIKYTNKEILDNIKYMIPNINTEVLDEKNTEENCNNNDIDDKLKKNENDLIEINEFCILNNIKLILSTNFDECVQCIYQLTTLKINIKSLHNPKDDVITNDTLIELLCKIEGINKNDAMALLNYYKSIKNICISTENNDLCKELNILPLIHFNEIDERKKKALYDFFHFSFKKTQ